MALNTVEQSIEGRIEDVDVVFDLDTLTLVGRYNDELSAHRAKKAWLKTLQDCFLLDCDSDINVRVASKSEQAQYLLVCEFISSCARYAFWRLTNNHVPEAAYLLETAHLPESKNKSYSTAPDMRAVFENELKKFDLQITEQKSIFKKIGELTRNLVKSL